MELSRQEYWSGLPFPSPGDLPNPGFERGSPALRVDSLPFEPPGKPCNTLLISLFTSYSCLYEGILLFLPLYPLQALHLWYCPLWALLTFKKPSYSSCYKLSNQICSLRCSDRLSFHRNYFFLCFTFVTNCFLSLLFYSLLKLPDANICIHRLAAMVGIPVGVLLKIQFYFSVYKDLKFMVFIIS